MTGEASEESLLCKHAVIRAISTDIDVSIHIKS